MEPRSPALQVDSLPAEPPGKPKIPQWVASPFSSVSSLPRNRTGSPALAGGFFTSWATDFWKPRMKSFPSQPSPLRESWLRMAKERGWPRSCVFEQRNTRACLLPDQEFWADHDVPISLRRCCCYCRSHRGRWPQAPSLVPPTAEVPGVSDRGEDEAYRWLISSSCPRLQSLSTWLRESCFFLSSVFTYKGRWLESGIFHVSSGAWWHHLFPPSRCPFSGSQ